MTNDTRLAIIKALTWFLNAILIFLLVMSVLAAASGEWPKAIWYLLAYWMLRVTK